MAEKSAFGPPSFDRAYVISDLHIGGEPGFQMFSSALQFEALIKYILKEPSKLRKEKEATRTLLVINGDFVDFLAEQRGVVFNIDRAADMLQSMFERAQFAPVATALQKFVEAEGTRLVMTLGNHDLELALPATRYKLLQLLTKGRGELERNVEFCFDGWGYRFQVAGRQALCLHGNESDAYNFTRYDELDRVVHELQFLGKSEFASQCRPSAGSWFVINAINPIKRDYPFIDLLKPEIPLAATALVMLDPRKLGYAEEAVRLKAQADENERQRPESQRRMLSIPERGEEETVSDPDRSRPAFARGGQIERSAERALADGTIDQLIFTPTDGSLLGWTDWLVSLREGVAKAGRTIGGIGGAVAKSLKGAARKAHLEALRTALLPLVSDDPYRPDILDDADVAVENGIRGQYDVVFAGHTHFRRIARRPNRAGLHVNTGTWAGLMSLTRKQVAGDDFSKIYAALMDGSREALKAQIREECTVALMAVGQSSQVEVSLGGVSKADDGSCQVRFPPELTVSVSKS